MGNVVERRLILAYLHLTLELHVIEIGSGVEVHQGVVFQVVEKRLAVIAVLVVLPATREDVSC